MEIWRFLKDPYLHGYEISNKGRIRNKSGRVLKSYSDAALRYPIFTLRRTKSFNRKFYIHRLVAEAFIPNPENKATVNHKDGNRLNNTVENLEWATQAENNNHARETGACNTNGENNAHAVLCSLGVREIRAAYKHGIRGEAKRLSIEYRVSAQCIRDVVYRRTWRHI